ncbi:sugar ABC transporter substrate-binding protein [Phyllobacterium brassicacearum]|uniref:Sugar ABC transporter substrate-binding protein n=2 Tax=Phyllobacterium brassicacearum TaxID=314235 RepID=A0A2P7BVF0_9HYPH|nr:sugar ABC transporter substrate-binding protein [Phyllobacterium brassicacearum]PSH70430.1 sugar ABC transporter substrate-binding protein [Phyllobacterium brassicacearum]TDQ27964.1 carbohydrate ABC transporter substrate-binding protein (CUT1 family) [Phyllobacterium brassicacearum]
MNVVKTRVAVSAMVFCLMSAPTLAEDLRVTVWTGNDAHLKMLNGIAESFKENHPDVIVKFETVPVSDYTQKLTFQVAGGNPPDIAWMMEDAAPAFENAGLLMDIGPTVKAAQGYDFDDFSQPAMALWQKGETVYGIPFSTSPFMIYYNKDMFDKAGLEDPLALAAKGEWTLDKFQETAKKLAEANPGKWGFEFKDGEGYASRMTHALLPSIRAYGGDIWTNGQCGFDKPEAIAAVKQLHDMVFKDKSIVPPGEQGDYFSGNSAMTDNQISRASKMPEAGFNWGIAPLPTGPGGESPVIGQAGLVVFEQGKHKELAAQFVAHMTDKENVATMAQFFPPARKSVLDSEAFINGNKLVPAEQMKNVSSAITKGRVHPAHEKAPQILAAMAPRVDALWKPDANVEDALKGVCAAIQPLL